MAHEMRSWIKVPKIIELDIDLSIIEGKDLVAKDRRMFIGPAVSSDPYVEVYYGGKKKCETTVIDKTLNPVWNEDFKIRVRGDDFSMALKGRTDFTQLMLHIYDKDQFSKDDFMGHCVVPLNFTDPPIKTSTTLWYRVSSGSGKLRCIDAMGKIKIKVEISEAKGIDMEVGTMYTMPKRIQVALRWDTKGGQTTIDNSCVAIDEYGHILMDESVYFGHLTNSNRSIRCSGDMYEGESVFSCILHSVNLCVRAFYFIFTVATPDKTMNDLNNIVMKVCDETLGKSMYQWTPNISADDTAVFLMRISREHYCWNVSLIEDGDHMARDFGTLIPEIKGYSRDINPEIELNPKERIAIMRPDRSIRIKDYANNAEVDQNLGLGFGWKSTDRRYVDFKVSTICLDAHLSAVEVISYENLGADNGSIRYGGDTCNLDENEDDEEIFINLGTVDSDIMYVGFVISSRYGEELDHIEKAKCHLFNLDTKIDLALYRISDDVWSKKYTGLLVLCFCRGSGDWTLRSIEEPTVFGNDADGLKKFLRNAPVLEPTAVPDGEIILNEMPDVNHVSSRGRSSGLL